MGSRVVVLALVLMAALVVGYFAFGMPGMDMSEPRTRTDQMDGMPGMSQSRPTFTKLSVDEFASEIGRPESFLVNVHVPYEGEISGTDALIPFDRIAGDARLPADSEARVLVYCRTGRMSAIAAATLNAEGFTDVVELRGGTAAWTASGRTLDMLPGR